MRFVVEPSKRVRRMVPKWYPILAGVAYHVAQVDGPLSTLHDVCSEAGRAIASPAFVQHESR